MADFKTRLRSLDADALSDRELALVALAGLVLIAALFWIGFSLLDPAPPRVLVISAGRPGGGYWAAAQRYRELFATYGIKLEVRESSGSVENLGRLRESSSGVNIALIQSGTGSEDDAEDTTIESVASVYYEPILVFHRLPGVVNRLSQLRGKRIVVGDPGSGTLLTAEEMLGANGVSRQNTTFMTFSPEAGVDALLRGEADAVFVIAAAESPVVQKAFHANLSIVDFDQADAYARRYPWLARLNLPRGSVNLGSDYPGTDVRLLAPTANLVIRSDLNPALTYLLLEIATDVHEGPGLFQRAGEFPAAASQGFAPSAEAKRYFQSGKPFFQRYLPFWVANRIERTLVVIIPLLVILIPLMRVGPAIVRWRKKARVNRLYGELREIERRFPLPLDPGQAADLDVALHSVEKRAAELRLPLHYGSDQFQLRTHVQLLRARANAART